MAINENNIETTPGTNSGGTSVSTPNDPIKLARRQIYDTMKSTTFTFEDFEAAIDDPDYGDEVLESLASDPKLKGWNKAQLQSALFEGKLNGVSSQGSEPTSVQSSEPSPVSLNSENTSWVEVGEDGRHQEWRELSSDPTQVPYPMQTRGSLQAEVLDYNEEIARPMGGADSYIPNTSPDITNPNQIGKQFVGGMELTSLELDEVSLEEDAELAKQGFQRLRVDMPSNDPLVEDSRSLWFQVPLGTQVISPRLASTGDGSQTLQYIDADGNRKNAIETVTIAISKEEAARRSKMSQESLIQSNGDITTYESIKNSLGNMVNQLQGFDDRLSLMTSDVFEKILGKDLGNKIYDMIGRTDTMGIPTARLDLNMSRDEAYRELDRLGSEVLPTIGVLESARSGDAAGLAAGIVNAVTSLATTAVSSAATAGAGLVTEMVGGSLYDYNNEKAKALGVSVKNLISSNKADFWTPFAIGVVGSGLERVGLKGTTRILSANLVGSVVKKSVILGIDMNKEGLTENLQYGLESYGKAVAQGKTQTEAISELGKAMLSDQGIESYLQGLLGSGAAGFSGRMIRGVVDKASRGKIQESAESIVSIFEDLKNSQDPVVKSALLEAAANSAEVILESRQVNNDKVSKLSEEQATLVEAKQEELSKLELALAQENLSEPSKRALEDTKNQVDSEIEAIFKETPAESVDETGGDIDTAVETTPDPNVIVSELSEPTFFQNLMSSENRSSRITELEARLRGNLTDDSVGIAQDPRQKAKQDLAFLRDFTEYAVLKIADGTVSTLDAFKAMTKGMGDFGDDVLHKAYYSAKNVVKNYMASDPTLSGIDEATGNILVKLQDPTVNREPAKTKVTSKDVKNLVDGGTRGEIKKTIKQAQKEFYATLEKGAKLGVKAAQERSAAFRSKVSNVLKDTLKSSPVKLSKGMSNKVLSTLTTRIASARTDADLDRVLDYVDRLVSKAENVEFAERLADKVAKAKKASRSERLPANIKEVLGKFGRIAPRDLMRSEIFESYTNKFISDIVGRIDDLQRNLKTGSEGKGNIAEIEKLNNDLNTLETVLEDERFSEDLPVLEGHLRELGKLSGSTLADSYYKPKSYSDYNTKVQELEDSIPADAESPKTKSKSREGNEDFVLNNLGLIKDLDRSEFTPQENVILDGMQNITGEVLDKMSDADVYKLAIGLSNVVNNGRMDGIGSAVYKAKAKALAMDESFTKPVSRAILSIPALGGLLGPNGYRNWIKFMSSRSQLIDGLFRDMFTKGKFMGLFGLQDYKEGRNAAQLHYEDAQKRFEKLIKSDEDVRKFMRSPRRGVEEVKVGIYAWFSQNESGMSKEEVAALRKNKIKTLKKMSDILGRDLNSVFEWQDVSPNKNYFSNVKLAIDEFVSDPDFELDEGQRKVYEFGLTLFDSVRADFLANARLFNNVDLDANIDNYFPIDYQFYDESANLALLDTSYDRAFSNPKISGRSGSKSSKDRIIANGELPNNGIIDFKFIDNMFKNYGLQLADIHTQGPRMQIHHNLMDKDLRVATKGNNFFRTIGDMMQEEMQENYKYFKSPKSTTLVGKIKRNIMSTAYARALGGFSQGFKQFVPTITDSLVRTGDYKTAIWYLSNYEKAIKFMQGQDIMRRGVQSSQMGGTVTNDLTTGAIPNKAVRSLSDALDWHNEFLNNVFLKPLQFGDVLGARMSWMMYYNQYAKKNGIPVDLDKRPNKEAAAYADNMVDVTANTSVDSGKSKFTQNVYARALVPFSGASINSAMNMAVNTSKLVTAIQSGDVVNSKEALKAMAANSAAIVLFQTVGWAIRWSSYLALKNLSTALVSGIDMDDEEEELKTIEELKVVINDYYKKRVDRNIENSIYYAVNDMIHRGILSQGIFQAATDATIKPVFEKITGMRVNSYKSSDEMDGLFELAGVYGIVPAGFYGAGKKNIGIFDSEEESLQRSGYGAYFKADGTYGFEGLDSKKMPESLVTFQKLMNAMSIASAFGFQDQFTSSLTRTAPKMYKQFEEAIYGDVPKVKDITSNKKFEDKFSKLTDGGREMPLDSKEQKLFRKHYDEAYKKYYKEYTGDLKGMVGDGPKLEDIAIKYLYDKAKKSMLADTEFGKLWDAKSTKVKR